MKQLFATFSEDDEEQKQLNIEAAKRSVNKTEAQKKLLIDEGFDDFVPRAGKTLSPVGDILGVGGGIVAGYAAMKNPLMALGVAGVPNPNSPTFTDELSLDMVMNKGLPINPFRGAKRIGKLITEVFPDQIESSAYFFNQLFQKPNIVKQAEEVFSGRLFGVTGGDFPAISKKGFDPNITKKNLELFNQIGWTDTAKLDIQDMLYGIDDAGKPLMSQYKRRVLKAGIGDETFNWSAFTQNRDEVVRDFLDGLQDLNIDPKTIHGHHISALRITSSLFDGLSPIQRKKLIKVFQQEGLQLGNHPDNLMALHKSTHLDVVHPFLEQQIGKYGQRLIDPAKIKKMTPKQRRGLVKKFAKIIRRSEEIAMENTRTWLDDTFEGMSPDAAFDARLDMLNKAFDDDIAFREQLLKSVKSEEPLLPYQAEDVEIPVTPKPKKTRVTSKQTKFKNLLKRIKTENPSWKQMTIWEIDDDALDAYRKFLNNDR